VCKEGSLSIGVDHARKNDVDGHTEEKHKIVGGLTVRYDILTNQFFSHLIWQIEERQNFENFRKETHKTAGSLASENSQKIAL